MTAPTLNHCHKPLHDELAKAAAHNTPLPAVVFFHVISDASIKTVEAEPRVINLIEGED
jgi:hypothetical protein